MLEIAHQMPRVAGFWTWKNLGIPSMREPREFRLAPIVEVTRNKDSEAEKNITKQNTPTLLGFRNAYVFDISQTNAVDLPKMREISGGPASASTV